MINASVTLQLSLFLINIEWTPGTSTKIGNIAEGTTDPRVEFISHDFTQILIKFHFQNLE